MREHDPGTETAPEPEQTHVGEVPEEQPLSPQEAETEPEKEETTQ